MSTSLEYTFITRVVDDRNFRDVEKSQITEDFFEISETRQAFRYIRDTYHHPETAGLIPSRDALTHQLGQFPFHYPNDDVPILCRMMRNKKLALDLQVGLKDVQELYNPNNPEKAIQQLKQLSTKLISLEACGEDISLSSASSLLRERYNIVAASHGLLGIPFPWQVLNEATHGLQGGQFIVIYGRPKNMKSFLAQYIAVHAYAAGRRRVLYYTREMPPIQVTQRIACILAKINYSEYTGATLQPETLNHLFEIMDCLEEDEKYATKQGKTQPYLIVTSDRGTNGEGSGGVGWIKAKIEELEPDLLIVDGMYLLKDDRTNKHTIDWKQIAHVSQDLKQAAQKYNIPIIGVTQANRKAEKERGEDLTELAYADALGQDADAVLRASRIKNEDTGKVEILITCPGIRDAQLEGFYIQGEPCVSFDYLRGFTFSGDKAKGDTEDSRYKKRKGPKKSGDSIPTSITPKSIGAQTAFCSGSSYRAPSWKDGQGASPFQPAQLIQPHKK